MVARAWSGLMCLETQGTRGGGQTLDLGGAADSLTRGRLESTCVSEVPRWACRWRRSASRCLPDGHSGRDVGMGTGVADGPEVGRAGRRPGLKNTGPSAGRVGALGGSRETRRNSNFSRQGGEFRNLLVRRLYPLREIHRSTVASLERSKYPGLQAPLGSLRGRSPATTCRHTRADCRARLRQTILLPAHPLCSIRRSQDHGVSRPIASPAWQLLGLAVLHPCTSLVRSRHPAASELASESHLRSPGGISGPAGHPDRGTRASSRRSRILMHNIARS